MRERRHLVIRIKTENAAFGDSPGVEVARILRRMADEFENGGTISTPRDINGNKCGSVELCPS